MNMNKGQGRRGDNVQNFTMSKSLMSEKTHLPELDYKALAISRLQKMGENKGPTGRYDGLISYLKSRSGGNTQIDAAEVDRRLRTWFEDMITKLVQSPTEWDQDRQMDGKALMDYLSGIRAPAAQPSPPATAPVDIPQGVPPR